MYCLQSQQGKLKPVWVLKRMTQFKHVTSVLLDYNLEELQKRFKENKEIGSRVHMQTDSFVGLITFIK